MNEPLISIIIPIYNSEKSLKNCINSAIAQTYSNIEIVLVNDGSKDGSQRIIDDFCKSHSNIIAVNQENRGLAEARRSGVHAANGEFVNFLDSDDTLPSNALELLYNELVRNNVDLVSGNFIVSLSPTKIIISKHHEECILDKDGFLNYVLGWKDNVPMTAALSKRSIWTDDVFPPSNLRLPSEDFLSNIRLSQNISRIKIANNLPVYNYLYNPNSLTTTKVLSNKQALWEQYFKVIRDRLAQMGKLDKYEKSIKIQEIDRFAFYLDNINKKDNWYQKVISYRYNDFPLKYRIVLLTIKHPLLHKCLIRGYRFVKLTLQGRNR